MNAQQALFSLSSVRAATFPLRMATPLKMSPLFVHVYCAVSPDEAIRHLKTLMHLGERLVVATPLPVSDELRVALAERAIRGFCTGYVPMRNGQPTPILKAVARMVEMAEVEEAALRTFVDVPAQLRAQGLSPTGRPLPLEYPGLGRQRLKPTPAYYDRMKAAAGDRDE